MTIRIHDSLSRQSQPLDPVEPGAVRLYACGPTVYSDCHIGHLMGPVLFDAIARWIRARGYRVRFVNNITDIDDKIIRRAQESGETWQDIAQRYEKQYRDFLGELAVTTITDHPRCTDYVPQMVAFVEALIAADRAYPTSDGVYYDVARQPGYGKLSGRDPDEMQAGSRVERSGELRHPADFALWKLSKPGEPSWDSPWGPGRPGWHLECSVMSRELLGGEFDLHGGGDDLKFPHHENEIAQSEAHGDRFARCWIHHGLAQYEGKKIAKSDPRMRDPDFARQFDARWLVDTYGAPAIRFFLLRGHYRRPIDFEPGNVEGARTGLIRLFDKLGDLVEQPGHPGLETLRERPLPDDLAAHRERFCAAMDDDFNTGAAIAELFAIQNVAAKLDGGERDAALLLLRDLGRLLGLFQPGDRERLTRRGVADEQVAAVIDAVLAVRDAARAAKDFATADRLRDALAAGQVEIRDGADGSRHELPPAADERLVADLVEALLAARRDARTAKDFGTSDRIRDALGVAGVAVHDGPDGTTWELA